MSKTVSETKISIGSLQIGNDLPFVLIAGPCVMESREHALSSAKYLTDISKNLDIPLIYKTSFDKANRSSLHSERGVGLADACPVFAEIREKFGVPVVTDVHEATQCEILAPYVDVLQIPAFLCRQTDLLLAAGRTNLAVNIKKGQFLAPSDMKNVAEKLASTGNKKIMLCERGASFGYHNLVSDFRALPIMAQMGYPVIFDATHSVQQPGAMGDRSGGQREFVPVLARAAMAVGVAGIFIETHQDPDNAPSDGANMISWADLPDLLKTLKAFDELAKNITYSKQ